MRDKGTYTALVTPYYKGKIDREKVDQLITHQIEGGVEGIVLLGSTGEASLLTLEERKQLIKQVVEKISGRIPLIVATGCSSTRETLNLTAQAADYGADAAMVVTPYYVCPDQKGIYAHYEALSQQGALPIWLYDVPHRTGSSLQLATLSALIGLPHIAALKASIPLEVARIILSRFGKHFPILCGDDSQASAMRSAGAVGLVSVLSNLLPQEISEWVREGCSPTFPYSFLFDLMKIGPNPVVIKEAMSRWGLCTGEVRLPLTRLEKEKQEEVIQVLERLIGAKN
ncbi:MAG: 4-hydroxy-tetrahydrodipicolinate synthase [Chlamydiota bacterium]|nr:4-hydroxy-tetrahydrodipicolinate synthase [Chlamydiota bacterium]